MSNWWTNMELGVKPEEIPLIRIDPPSKKGNKAELNGLRKYLTKPEKGPKKPKNQETRNKKPKTKA